MSLLDQSTLMVVYKNNIIHPFEDLLAARILDSLVANKCLDNVMIKPGK